MNKRHYEHTLPNIRGSLSNTYDHVCFMTDMMIFYKTLKCVISRKGISQKGEATTKPFDGNN